MCWRLFLHTTLRQCSVESLKGLRNSTCDVWRFVGFDLLKKMRRATGRSWKIWKAVRRGHFSHTALKKTACFSGLHYEILKVLREISLWDFWIWILVQFKQKQISLSAVVNKKCLFFCIMLPSSALWKPVVILLNHISLIPVLLKIKYHKVNIDFLEYLTKHYVKNYNKNNN